MWETINVRYQLSNLVSSENGRRLVLYWEFILIYGLDVAENLHEPHLLIDIIS